MNRNILEGNIIAQLGLEKLPDEEKAALLEQMVGWVEKRVFGKILASLAEADKARFLEIMESGDQAASEEFLSQKVPNFAELLEQETAAAKQELAEFHKTLD
ncbi:MAG: hypothetical protein KGJ93_00090 [Patescibacteria group bacterium]|nr:hypothetical protein [Patescibacteria group bacterium]